METPQPAPEPTTPNAAANPVTLSHISAPRANAPLLTPEQWDEAEAMYVQGATATEIARIFHLEAAQVTYRASRCGWAEKRGMLKKAKAALDASQGSNKRADARERVLDGLSDVVEEGVQFLKKNPPKTRRQLREHFSAAREIVEVAKPVLGMAGELEQAPSLVNMQFLMNPSQFIRAATPAPIEVEARPA